MYEAFIYFFLKKKTIAPFINTNRKRGCFILFFFPENHVGKDRFSAVTNINLYFVLQPKCILLFIDLTIFLGSLDKLQKGIQDLCVCFF